ncbi:MAG: YcnI family protein [Actinomycetia bacterium]|nr:YcnI family protein [Actinomycetes bacterium]
MNTTLRRLVAPVIIAAGAVALGAAPASAHVGVTPSTTVAGEYAVLTFAVPHGCDGSATTKLAIEIPDGIDVVTPTINDGWTIDKQTEPVSSGDENERVARVTYNAKTPLADGYRDTFELSVALPTDAGRTLVFPTIQTCKKGKTAWTQVPEDGQSEDQLDAPAPSFTLTESEDGDEAPAEEVSSADTGDSSDGLAWTALGIGAAGVAVGGVALTRSRTRT